MCDASPPLGWPRPTPATPHWAAPRRGGGGEGGDFSCLPYYPLKWPTLGPRMVNMFCPRNDPQPFGMLAGACLGDWGPFFIVLPSKRMVFALFWAVWGPERTLVGPKRVQTSAKNKPPEIILDHCGMLSCMFLAQLATTTGHFDILHFPKTPGFGPFCVQTKGPRCPNGWEQAGVGERCRYEDKLSNNNTDTSLHRHINSQSIPSSWRHGPLRISSYSTTNDPSKGPCMPGANVMAWVATLSGFPFAMLRPGQGRELVSTTGHKLMCGIEKDYSQGVGPGGAER